MSTPFEDFRSWYSDAIRSLYRNRNAGFVILNNAFPLLERYTRQKLGLAAHAVLKDPFYDELVNLLPELKTRDRAREFWGAYRNGLLHTVTLSTRNHKGVKLPDAWFSHDNTFYFLIDANGHFWLNPVPFTERVLNIIESDFNTFAIGHSGALPQVRENVRVPVGGVSTFTHIVTGPALPSTAYVPWGKPSK